MSARSKFVAWNRNHIPDDLVSSSPKPQKVRKLTTGLLGLYSTCNTQFRYLQSVPTRCLTKPSQPVHNAGYDNTSHDYILHVNDVLSDDKGNQFAVLDLLGTGTFGQVVKCRLLRTGEIVAVKVIKNQPAYFNQAWVEINILRMLHRTNNRHIVNYYAHFMFRGHLCLVFEKLSINLYELLKQNNHIGVNIETLRRFITQLLEALCVLVHSDVIHCDLKPENILLKDLNAAEVKIIDFGSACMLHYPIYNYVQSRFYRSPEVLLGFPEYDSKIDMWSLGCVAGELFLGIPLFPGQNEMNMICRMVEMLGDMPDRFLRRCRRTSKFFNSMRGSEYAAEEMHAFQLKSIEQFQQENSVVLPEWKRFFKEKKLRDIIMTYPHRTSPPNEEEIEARECFIDLLNGMLRVDPKDRWTPQEALQHPFIQGRALPEGRPWVPPGRGARMQRSRPIFIRYQGEVPTPVDEVYAASAPNFNAMGHINMNTSWGTGAGGQPAVVRSGNGMLQVQLHQQPFHQLPPQNQGGGGSSFTHGGGGTYSPALGPSPVAPGSYVSPSTLLMYGQKLNAARMRQNALQNDSGSSPKLRPRASGELAHSPGTSFRRDGRMKYYNAPGVGGESYQRVSSLREQSNQIPRSGTPPLPHAALRFGNNMQRSGSRESLTGSIRLSGSRESLGMVRVPSTDDVMEDVMMQFPSEDEAFSPLRHPQRTGVNPYVNEFHMATHPSQLPGNHWQPYGSGMSTASGALPPPGPRLNQPRGSSRPAPYGCPSSLSTYSYTSYQAQTHSLASQQAGSNQTVKNEPGVMDIQENFDRQARDSFVHATPSGNDMLTGTFVRKQEQEEVQGDNSGRN